MKVNKNATTSMLLAVLILIISTLAYFFNTLGYSAGLYFLPLILVLVIFLDVDKIFYVLMFCLPFSSILKFSTEGITVLPFIYAIVIVKLLFFKSTKISVGNILCFITFAILQIFSVLFYKSNIISITSFFLNVFFIIICGAYLRQKTFDNKMIKNASAFFSISVILNIALCYIFPNIPYVINAERQTALVSNNRFASMVLDPNEFAQLVLIAIFLLIFLLFQTQSKKWKIICLIGIVYLAINGYNTYSKSYVLSLLILWILWVLMYISQTAKKKGNTNVIIKLIPISCILLLGIMLIYNNAIVPVLEARADYNADLLSGRGEIWSEYISTLVSRLDVLIFGCGANNTTYLIGHNDMLSGTVTHNMYLEYLIQFGILGIILLFGAWSKNIKAMLKKSNTYIILALIAFLITAFGISSNANDCIFILMLLFSMPYSENINN